MKTTKIQLKTESSFIGNLSITINGLLWVRHMEKKNNYKELAPAHLKKKLLRCNFLYLCISAILFSVPSISLATDSEFEEDFLKKDKNGVSPEIFLIKNTISPGIKNVDVYLNDRLVDEYEINFIKNDEKKEVIACLPYQTLKTIGIKVENYDSWKNKPSSPHKNTAEPNIAQVCEDLIATIPQSSVNYDETVQILKIQIPQIAVDTQRFTMISPKEWDDGVANLRTSYSGYYYQTQLKKTYNSGIDDKISSAYINLNSVAGLGPWRLYSIDSLSRDTQGQWDNNHDRLYLSRDFAPVRGTFAMGDLYTKTKSSIFSSIPLRGISLNTSENMMLDNEFNYAPVIRGVARTNARIYVRQRSNIIYSATLTPGEFAINDIYSAQVGADLEVTVEEADGTKQIFWVPYTSLPNLLRPGALRYATAIGQYRDGADSSDQPWLGTANIEYGFEKLTLNSTLLIAENYQSAATGAAWNVGSIGAFSFEFANATYRDIWNNNVSHNGSALRLLYAKQFSETDTGLQILGYQYRSENFLDFSEFMSRYNYEDIDGYDYGDNGWNRRRRSRVEMNINQGLGGKGSLYFSFSQDRFYNTADKSTSISGGAGTNIGSANISLTWTYTKDSNFNDNQLNLNISIPLNWGRNSESMGTVNYGLTRNSDNRYNQTLGYSGTVLDNSLNYSANLQRDTEGNYSESLSAGYTSSLAAINGSVGHNDSSMQFSAGMSGGLLVYSGGVMLTPALGTTIGIIETPDTSGIGINSNNNAKTDYWGRAVVNYLTPYRYNTLTLDTTHAESVELKETTRKVVPSEGAAVLLRFATRTGRRAMVKIKSAKQIPLGAPVYIVGEKEEAGIMGNKNMIYLSGLDALKPQTLQISWGDSSLQQCQFTLPPANKEQLERNNWYKTIIAHCK